MGNLNGYIIFRPEDKPTPEQILKHALNFLKKFGWQRGALGGYAIRHTEEYTPACALGAIEAVTRGNFYYGNQNMAKDKLRRAIETPRIANWNDNIAQNKEEIFAAFEKAIKNE